MLREDIPIGDSRCDDAVEIVAAAARAAGVARQLLAFSRRQALESEDFDLAEVVRESGGMLRKLLPAGVAFHLSAESLEVRVRAARTPVEQIVLNLAINGRDAMPAGGTLTLDVRTSTDAEGNYRALLTVTDTGTGIPPGVRDRIFEPFFTTKPPGKGTGLGLATVNGVVHQFNGTLEVR